MVMPLEQENNNNELMIITATVSGEFFM